MASRTQKDILHYLFSFKPWIRCSIIVLLLWLPNEWLQAQEQTLTGVVLSSDDTPLPYASIFVQEQKGGTVTNEKGEFILHLSPGYYHLEVRYIGYTTVHTTLQVQSSGNSPLRFVLSPVDYELGDVVVVGKKPKEDPAYPIMRELIARTAVYEHMAQNYRAEVYTKGSMRVDKVPALLLSMSDEDGIKLSDLLKKTMVLESHASISYTSPDQYDREVHAMRTSVPTKLSEQMGIGSSEFMDVIASNIYGRMIGLGVKGSLPSPIRENAFDVYTFKLEGTTTEGDCKVHRISFQSSGILKASGELLVEDRNWLLRYIMVDASFQGILQQKVECTLSPLLPGIYMPSTYSIATHIATMGLDASVNYYSSLRYDSFNANQTALALNKFDEEHRFGKNRTSVRRAKEIGNYLDTLGRAYPDKYFVPDALIKVTSRVDSLFAQRDSSYWNQVVSTPLTEDELNSYAERDSLEQAQQAEKKPATKDDTEPKKENLFMHLLLGKTWDLSPRTQLSYGVLPGLLHNYTYTDGLWTGQNLEFTHRFNKALSLSLSPEIYYSTQRRLPYWGITATIKYAPMRQGFLQLKTERKSTDLAGRYAHSQAPGHTLFPTLINGRGAQLLYDRLLFQLLNSIDLFPGFKCNLLVAYSHNRSLPEAQVWGLRKGADIVSWGNYGATRDKDHPSYSFPEHRSLVTEVVLEYNPTPYYRIDNKYGRKQYLYRGLHSPIMSLSARYALPMKKEFDSDFLLLTASIRQTVKLSYWSSMEYNLEAGSFVRRNVIHPEELVYLKADNQPWLINGNLHNKFFTLPSYTSAALDYIRLHTEWHIPPMLMRLFPTGLFSMANESFHLSGYWGWQSKQKPYFEAGYSIGYDSFLRVGFFYGGYNFYENRGFGLRFSMEMPKGF